MENRIIRIHVCSFDLKRKTLVFLRLLNAFKFFHTIFWLMLINFICLYSCSGFPQATDRIECLMNNSHLFEITATNKVVLTVEGDTGILSS